MTEIPIQNRLTAPHQGNGSPIQKLTAKRIHLRISDEPKIAEPRHLWGAEWWGFQRSQLFAKLTPNSQHDALSACNRSLLNEAYFIEKSGITYSAKMMLLAETTDVAQLYAHIAADEATHLAWIEPHITDHDRTRPQGQFLAFLSELIEQYRPELLVYLVQVILEGWGLNHYKRLMDGCHFPALTEVFREILKDEALHHHSGTVLFDAARFSRQDYDKVVDAMKCYADMVRVGPFAAIAAFDKVAGGLSRDDVMGLLTALDHLRESTRKLNLLKSLMQQPGMTGAIEKMNDAGYFAPYGVADAANYYLQHRP